MSSTEPWMLVGAFFVAMLAGAINSIAGGGTILTYPLILLLVGDGKIANITSCVGLWPASLGGAWGYRRDMEHLVKPFRPFFIISFVGGGIGALLLLVTPVAIFAKLIPFLILGATTLFATQTHISAWLNRRLASAPRAYDTHLTSADDRQLAEDGHHSRRWWLVVAAQMGVAIYGGYFGAGIGILMLALLGFLGLTNIYQMNGLKNLGALCINGLAVAIFIVSDRAREASIHWPVAGAMALGGILGGYFCVGLARKVGPKVARQIIVAAGLAGAIYTAWRVWGG